MNTAEAEELAHELMAEFAVGPEHAGWRFAWDKSVRRFGQCRFRLREIGLSRPLTELNGKAEVEDVIRHELAHVLAGEEAKHGPTWRRYCAVTGARPERCYDSNVVEKPPAPWKVECERCGVIGERHRRPSGVRLHSRCGSPVRFIRSDELREGS